MIFTENKNSGEAIMCSVGYGV